MPTAAVGSYNCFTGESLVSMADGSFRPIADVNVGDIVSTGAGRGQGIVTDKASNQMLKDEATEVIVATTLTGEVVGTANHPVLLDGEWKLLGDIAGLEAIPPIWSKFISKIERQQRAVDVWYDLEIDGGADGHTSSHSYVVHGMVVFGKLLKNFDFSLTSTSG
jgi:Hint-domain